MRVHSATQAKQLEDSTPAEFAAAANSALGNRASTPASPLTAGMQQALSGVFGGGSSSSGGGTGLDSSGEFRPPPLVTGWVGGPPRSFPLQLCHAGRCS